jgi:hypothetical protein
MIFEGLVEGMTRMELKKAFLSLGNTWSKDRLDNRKILCRYDRLGLPF